MTEANADFERGFEAGVAAGRAGVEIVRHDDTGELWLRLAGGLAADGDPVGELIQQILASRDVVRFMKAHSPAELLQALGGALLTTGYYCSVPQPAMIQFTRHLAQQIPQCYEQMDNGA